MWIFRRYPSHMGLLSYQNALYFAVFLSFFLIFFFLIINSGNKNKLFFLQRKTISSKTSPYVQRLHWYGVLTLRVATLLLHLQLSNGQVISRIDSELQSDLQRGPVVFIYSRVHEHTPSPEPFRNTVWDFTIGKAKSQKAPVTLFPLLTTFK